VTYSRRPAGITAAKHRAAAAADATGSVAGNEAGAILVAAARSLLAHMTHDCGARRSVPELIGIAVILQYSIAVMLF